MITITGRVIEGKKIGRTRGFPTVNVRIPSNVKTGLGIFAGRVKWKKQTYGAAIYLAGNGIAEAFMFDFNEDIYGQDIAISIVKRIRENMEFINDQQAKEQITKDVEEIKAVLLNV